MAELALPGIIFLSAIFLLIKSSFYVVRSLSVIARYLRISEFVIAFILLALATSLSELTIGVNAAVAGIPILSLGDVLGTNVVNLTLILGILAVAGNGVKLDDYKQFKDIRTMTVVLLIMPFLLMYDGALSRLDGLVLLVLFVYHLLSLARTEKNRKILPLKLSLHAHAYHSISSRRHFIQAIFIFILAVCFLVGSAFIAVQSIEGITRTIGVSEFIIGLFIIAIGTSLPELTVGLRSIRDKVASVSIGNIFGAVTTNVSLVLGIVALIEPIHVTEPQQFILTAAVTLLIVLFLFTVLRKKHIISRRTGIILLLVYAGFITMQSIVSF